MDRGPVWQEGEFPFRSLVSIHVYERGNPAPSPMGSGFIVGALGDHVIALSAAHVFKGMVERLAPLRGHPSIPLRTEPDWDKVLKDSAVAVIEEPAGTLRSCPIKGFRAYPDWDVVALVIGPPKAGWTEFPSAIQIDTAIPKVGMPVAAVGCDALGVGEVFPISGGGYGQEMERRPITRIGRITEVDLEGSGLLRGPGVRLDIPTTEGMSGGPVLLWDPEQKSKHTAVAVISTDISNTEAHHDCFEPGDSTAALVANALPLNFELTYETETVSKTVQDLIRDGRIHEPSGSSRLWEITFPETGSVQMRWQGE